LHDISFTLHKGERIALVGSNGSGKTTLVKLLLRLYDASEGEILMDGVNIKEYDLKGYRDCFGTVFQDFKMFSLSVKDNVLLRPSVDGDDQRVKDALVESGAYGRVERMEKGIDTILTREFDDKGENLSVGEQQKLSLARVFADRTPFVLLDEPSSALDPIAEYKMFENMMRATEGRSVIFISHRLSSAVLADRVLLMDGGTVAECGTHAELLAKNGIYADMFRRQAENYLGSEVSVNG
jgi:ATP-binding cassette subfamily B protein